MAAMTRILSSALRIRRVRDAFTAFWWGTSSGGCPRAAGNSTGARSICLLPCRSDQAFADPLALVRQVDAEYPQVPVAVRRVLPAQPARTIDIGVEADLGGESIRRAVRQHGLVWERHPNRTSRRGRSRSTPFGSSAGSCPAAREHHSPLDSGSFSVLKTNMNYRSCF